MVENIDTDELKEVTNVDNSKLEKLLQEFKDNPRNEVVQELGEEIKKSQLFLPIVPSDSMFEGIEDAEVGDVMEIKQPGFDINYLTTNDGKKAIPLFTSSEVMEKANLRSSTMVMYVEDLVNMLQGAEERYELVTINPMAETGIDMPIFTFLNLFKEVEMNDEEKKFYESLNQMLEILENHSIELESKTTLFTRGPNDFMKEAAVDGVFVPNIPFSVSTIKEFEEEISPYTNILLMDEGKKIVIFGEATLENPFNVMLAPGTEFEMVEELDEFTTVWKCGNQPFYDK